MTVADTTNRSAHARFLIPIPPTLEKILLFRRTVSPCCAAGYLFTFSEVNGCLITRPKGIKLLDKPRSEEDAMKDTISKLLEAYEKGKMSRRTLIQGLAVLAAGSTAAEAAGFQGNSINHISLQVSNLQRSTDFYQRVFECKVNKREGNNQ